MNFSPLRSESALSANMRGALWLVASSAAFTVMNAMIKHLGQEIHPFQLAFFRCFFGFIAIAPFALRGGVGALKTSRWSLHALRAVVGVIAMLAIFYAVAQMPLAEVTAIVFSKSLFMIVLAAFFLGEKIGWHRGAATVIGFIGVLIMVGGVGFQGGVSIAAGAALFHAFCLGVVLILIKKLSATETPTAMVFYFSAAASIGTLIPSLPVWVMPDMRQMAWLAVMGAIASLAQYMAVRAYRVGEASVVTPMDYLQLPFAAVLGFALFGEAPTLYSLGGAIIIIASSFYLLRAR